MSNHEFTNWTALPNGIVGNTVRLSVFVTPKLLGEAGKFAQLLDYQAILKWPETIGGLKLRVEAQVDGGGGVTLQDITPANKGEFGPNAALWNALFSEHTLVEPFASDEAPAIAAASRRMVPVYYRSAPLQALVEESYAVQARLALSDLESEPPRPKFKKELESFDSPDALLNLAAGSDPSLLAQQFATKEGDDYVYRPAQAVTEFFGEDKLTSSESALAAAINEPLTSTQIRELFNAFSLYHKRGVRNKLHQIRAQRRWTSTDPNFNFLSSNTVQITKDDHGKEYEFAESRVTVLLPELTDVERGFEVFIAYSPNEALPAPSNDADETQKTLRATDESTDRYDQNLIVQTTGANLFQDGTSSTRVAAQRAKRICWDGAQWIAFDRNDLDFHAILSALTSYPSLLRRLGWVFDLEIALKDLFPQALSGGAFTGRIRIEPVWSDPANAPTVSSPWTMYKVGELSGATEHGISLTSFSPRVDPSLADEPIAAGFRDLSKSRTFQYDLDAAVIKTVQKAVREADRTDRYLPSYRIEIPGSPRAAALNATKKAAELLGATIDIDPQHRAAAIRSTGLSLYADREYAKLAQNLKADATRTNNFATRLKAALAAPAVAGPKTVAGDDVYLNAVVAGYVVDVNDNISGQWHSLCERQVVFEFENGALPAYLAPADEGWLSAEGAVEVDEKGHRQLRINENFFRWDGWSLVAPNPSEKLKECDPVDAGPPPKNIGLRPRVELKPLSLARLRFGRRYQFRARLADLAGNAWPLAYANGLNAAALASEQVTYRRFDPINPPFLVPLQPPGPGTPIKKAGDDAPLASKGPEKGEMLVIRSGLSAAAATGEWLVLPPEVKFQEAEWIGMFDAFDKPDKAYATLARYCGALPEKYDPKFIGSITWPGGKLATPYLPDGHAKGAAFSYLPGGMERKSSKSQANVESAAGSTIDSTTTFEFELDLEGPSKKNKPFAQPFYFRLTTGKKRKKPEKAGRRLTVTLPPGEQQLIRVSSIPIGGVDVFAQVQNAFEANQEAFLIQPRDAAKLGNANWGPIKTLTPLFNEAIAHGQFWPLTPQKNLYLVHAVPKPLVPVAKNPKDKAVFKFSENLTVTPRVTGGIATVLHDPSLRVHRVSTGRIDVYAEWDEYSDGAGTRDCPHKERRRHLCFSSDIDLPDITIEPDESHLTVDFARRHEFPATKHYAAKYVMVATTRYREYYDPKLIAKSENITIKSEESEVFHILNTNPPPVPEFVYVIPILIWEDAVVTPSYAVINGATIGRKVRRGLRVYMRRSWYASGEDERLGLVFAPKSTSTSTMFDADPENQIPVTQWGTNPIWHTTPIKRQPTVDDAYVDPNMRFEGIKVAKTSTTALLAAQRDDAAADASASGKTEDSPLEKFREADKQVMLAPEQIQLVDVAAFDVHCDLDKDLLYADVEFKETDSYSPMVKMALARIQPHSAPYAHLSPVTNWVFHAIAPARTIAYGIVSEINENPRSPTRQIKFAVSGTFPGNSRQGYRENSLEVLLFDGEAEVSELQVPLTVDDITFGFRIPVAIVESLKRPTVHLKEFEHVGNDGPRLVLACQVPLNLAKGGYAL
jgi:hypothetical protein